MGFPALRAPVVNALAIPDVAPSGNQTITGGACTANWTVVASTFHTTVTLAGGVVNAAWVAVAPAIKRTINGGACVANWSAVAPTLIKGLATISGGANHATWTVPAAVVVASGSITAPATHATWVANAPVVVPGKATIAGGTCVAAWHAVAPAMNGVVVASTRGLNIWGWKKPTSQ